MDEDGHVHVTDQLKKGSRARRIEILPFDAGVDHDAFELVLLNGSFRLLKNLIVVEGHGAGEADQPLWMLRRQLRGVLVELFDHAKSVGTIRRANPIVAENSHVDTGLILLFEQAVQIENRLRRLRMEPPLWH